MATLLLPPPPLPPLDDVAETGSGVTTDRVGDVVSGGTCVVDGVLVSSNGVVDNVASGVKASDGVADGVSSGVTASVGVAVGVAVCVAVGDGVTVAVCVVAGGAGHKDGGSNCENSHPPAGAQRLPIAGPVN